MHDTLEQFEDAINKRINTDVMLRIENLKKDNQKALGDLETQIGESISQRMLSASPTHLLLEIQIHVSWGTRLKG